MFKENKINLFIMVKFTIRKIQNPHSVYNKIDQLDLKCLNDKVKQMILKNDIKLLNEAIKNGKEKIENKGKYKRYRKLQLHNIGYRRYMTVTQEEEGGYIYLGYKKISYSRDKWYHIFKIGQSYCAECRMRRQGLDKILAIKVRDSKAVEDRILNECYIRNIQRCRGEKDRNCTLGWRADPREEKIHGKEWFATLGGVNEYEKMKNQMVEIVKDTINYGNNIGMEIQQLEKKEYYLWRKNKNGKYKRHKTNWWYHYQEEVRISKILTKNCNKRY